MKSNSGNRLRDYSQLSKFKIMLPVSLTGFTGYFIFDPHLSLRLFSVSLGVFLMAVAASALNQIQEITLDSRMERTHDRPIPAGRISLTNAGIFSLCCLISGIFFIYAGGNLTSTLIGVFTLFWYNVVYTYSKRITAFAVVPGALTGALPPLIGWVAAGGGMWDKPIVFIEFLFFIGQIPHFWLLILKYGEEYSKAGIPALTDVFSVEQINRLTFTWVVTSVIAAVFLCYLEVIRTAPAIIILLLASAFLIWKFSMLVRNGATNRTYRPYFIVLDSYFLLVMVLLIVDRVIG
jgi:protoheme IX farnesyltransferase